MLLSFSHQNVRRYLFPVVQNLLCSPDTFVTQRSGKTDPPVKLDFFICPDSGHLMSRIEVYNMFSIFDMSSMDGDCEIQKEPVPFLNVDTVIIDESNFDTNSHSRYLRTEVNIPRRSLVSPR